MITIKAKIPIIYTRLNYYDDIQSVSSRNSD